MSDAASFAPGQGRILLVGAGPGAADLLTLRAVRALAAADVVVHDGLVGDDVMALIPAAARTISVAKRRARHTMAQAEIGALLVAEALAGHTVVRLKGGDPFVFGRGGEEVADAMAAGVPVEVVPGISSALGAAAAAQMPLTHRDHASIVSFVAGECKGLAGQDWAGLAGKGRTLVIFMGLAGAERIADKLMADGLAPDTPVAVVERATLPGMRVVRSLLADLGGLVAREAIVSPALIVVGSVANLPSRLREGTTRRSRAGEGSVPTATTTPKLETLLQMAGQNPPPAPPASGKGDD